MPKRESCGICHAGGRLSTRCRPQRRHAISIEPAAPPGAPPTAISCLGASRTPAHARADRDVTPASEKPAQGLTSLRLFDHLVGDRLQRQGHSEAKRLGGFEVDHKLKLGRAIAPADRQVSRP